MQFVREDKFLIQIIHFFSSFYLFYILHILFLSTVWDVIYKVLIFNTITVLMESLIGPGPLRSQLLQLARPLQDLCLCFYQARVRVSFNSFCLLTLNLVFLSCILITFFPHPHILPGLSHLLTHPTPCSSSFSNNNHKIRQNNIYIENTEIVTQKHWGLFCVGQLLPYSRAWVLPWNVLAYVYTAFHLPFPLVPLPFCLSL